MKIYAASLSDYNNGRLHGAWIDLDGKSIAGVQAEVEAMLKASPTDPLAEEWLVHDYDCPRSCQLGETSDIPALVFQAEMLEKHGDAWVAYMDLVYAADANEDDFNERYAGCYDSVEAWADDYAESCGLLESVPENLRYYFDMKAWARDAEMSGDVTFAPGEEGVHVFNLG